MITPLRVALASMMSLVVVAIAMAYPDHHTQTLQSPPSWVLPSAGVDLNFANGSYWSQGRNVGVDALLTFTRATVAWEDNRAGIWQQFPSGVPRITDNGLLIEEARTNNALWARDMTQAGSWTVSNMTSALTATGIDATASSASTLTASAANGTVLQSVTLGSAAHVYGVWLKRVTGTGEVDITIDNGTTWTSETLTTTWTRFQVTKTAANPVVGIRIVVNGDSIAADFSQLESGTFSTSPILTTTVAVTRNVDQVTMTSSPIFGPGYSLLAYAVPNAPNAFATVQVVAQIDDGTANNRLILQRQSSTAVPTWQSISGGSSTSQGTSTWSQSALGKFAVATQVNSQVGAFGGTATSTGAGSLPVAVTTVRFGNTSTGSAPFDGYIQRLAIWPIVRLSQAAMQSLTQ